MANTAAHLKLILGAGLVEGARWAREHLYTLLVLSPLVLGMTYVGVGRMLGEEAGWRPSRAAAAALAAGACACLIALSMSRASVELYHLRRPETLFDALPVAADAHLYAALARRAARTAAAAVVALVARKLLGGELFDVWLVGECALFVALVAAGEVLAALEWIHWAHRREVGHALVALAALAACAGVAGLLLLLIVRPGMMPQGVRPAAVFAGAGVLTTTLLLLAFALHRRWRTPDSEFAKRLGARDRRGLTGEWAARRFGASPAVAAQFARDLQLTLRGFSSAVYVAAGVAALFVVVLAAVLTAGWLPPNAATASWLDATWLPKVLAVKFAGVLASVSLVSLVPVLVAHQTPHLWLERATGVAPADVWRAKLWYARAVSLPAPLAVWVAGVLCGASPVFYALPLLAENLWAWWIVSTLAGGLAYEMPDEPGLSLVLIACVALGAGGFVAFLWPMGLALYAMGLPQMFMRGQHRAHLHLRDEG
jgi:hypothetical protein